MTTIQASPARPTIGRIVHVTLSEALAREINCEPYFHGNAAREGDVLPMIIARVFGDTNTPAGLTVNGQLILDGRGTKWLTSVHHGDAPGCWHWPEHPQAAQIIGTLRDTSDEPLKQPSGPDFASMAAQECAQAADALRAELNRKVTRIAELEKRLAEVKAELERKRQHETHLIQERDRLIHDDCAKLQAKVAELESQLATKEAILRERLVSPDELRADRDECLAREKTLQGRVASLEQSLAAVINQRDYATRREQAFAERLAAIAAQVSDL